MSEKKFEKISEKLSLAVSDEHSFGTDAFLLASFSAPRRKDMVCDLGTGCGIIPFLMKKGFSPKVIYAVDIQENAINLLKESISVSGVDDIIPVCADLKTLWDDAPTGKLDIVSCNPPYKVSGAGIESELTAHKIARHEILCNIDDVCKAGAKLLKFGGKLCICNRPERLSDVIFAMKNNGIEPKTIRFVSKTPSDAPWLFLIEGRKGGKSFMNVMKNLYIKDENGNFSEEMMSIYEKEAKEEE